MKAFFRLCLVFVASSAFARLGETEAELTARFGKPGLRSIHSVITQGAIHEVGPSLHYRQDDWSIQANMTDGRCVTISYSKHGDWTEDQIQLVLGSNSQGAAWTETTNPSIKKLQRSWKRADGGAAEWKLGQAMTVVSPAYARAKAVVEAKAKAEASRKPKI